MKKIIFLNLFLLSLFLITPASARSGIEEPVLEDFKNDGGIFISGSAPYNAEVMVYVDGTYYETSSDCLNKEKREKSFFCYEGLSEFFKYDHVITLIAKDKTSLVLSPPVSFNFSPKLVDKIFLSSVNNNVNEYLSIIGESDEDSFVKVYVDDSLVGQFKAKKGEFYHELPINFKPGKHKIRLKAEKGATDYFDFYVEHSMPAPTLLERATAGKKLLGLAKNNSLIEVYINGKIDGSFKVKNSNTGTANFVYSFKDLSVGKNLVYTIAADSNGKKSIASNKVNLDFRLPRIAYGESERNDKVVSKIKRAERDSILNSENVLVLGDREEAILEVEDLEEKNSSGLLDEKDNEQNKLNLNLLIFLGFLILVIFWIVWINREIVKERNQKN